MSLNRSDLGGDRTSIGWSCTFEPRGVQAEQAAQMIEGIYRMFVARLKETLASTSGAAR